MVALPQTGTLRLIDNALIARAKSEFGTRNYLGCSSVGDDCLRRVWYEFYENEVIDNPRVQRIFDMGNIIEDYVVRLLREAGFQVWAKKANGEQFGVKYLSGRMRGHSDGVITGLPESSLPHLLEIKSAKNSIFNQFKKHGVKKQSSRYYGQMQLYMHGLKLQRSLFIMMNKDTQELYMERIGHDKFEAEILISSGEEVLNSPHKPLRREFNKSSHFKCRMCFKNEKCWEDER